MSTYKHSGKQTSRTINKTRLWRENSLHATISLGIYPTARSAAKNILKYEHSVAWSVFVHTCDSSMTEVEAGDGTWDDVSKSYKKSTVTAGEYTYCGLNVMASTGSWVWTLDHQQEALSEVTGPLNDGALLEEIHHGRQSLEFCRWALLAVQSQLPVWRWHVARQLSALTTMTSMPEDKSSPAPLPL